MFIQLFGIALAVFLAIDAAWLTLIAKSFYAKHIGYLMARNPNLWAAFVFYLVFIAGLVYFVIIPALDKKTWKQALFAGIFFGLVTYATYDLTNLATVKNWPLLVTVVDLMWGMCISGIVSVVTYFLALKWKI